MNTRREPYFHYHSEAVPAEAHLFGLDFYVLIRLYKAHKSIIELTALEITVAVATPLTVILRTITKKRLRITLRTPDTASAISGTFVSPMLLKIAASKLYSNMTGRPIRYILKYITARGRTSSGTLRELSILPTKIRLSLRLLFRRRVRILSKYVRHAERILYCSCPWRLR